MINAARVDETPGGWRPLVVAARVQETADIVTLDLRAPDGGTLPAFTAGAHIDVEAAPGLVRQYSLLNSPSERHRYRIGVLKDAASRGGSAAMHAIKTGDLVRIAGPRNQFELAPENHTALLLAGGIGVTPLLAMAHQLQRYGRDFTLHYCARSRGHAAFLNELQSGTFAAHVHTYFDDEADEHRLNLTALARTITPDSHIYICGPAGFMSWCIDTLISAGVDDARIHREYFKARAVTTEVGDSAFSVRLASTGAILSIPADTSILNVLRAHGINLPASCESGVCGTCLTGVLAGTPDHRDCYLSKPERTAGDVILPCCSRANSPLLVLDL